MPCNLVPSDNMDATEWSHDWLYSSLEPEWTDWMSIGAVDEQIARRASYAVSPMPGLRILSLNTIYAYNLNLLYLSIYGVSIN